MKGVTWIALPMERGVASARTSSPIWALCKWSILRWNPATLLNPDAICAPVLASASAIIADTPPCSTLNGCKYIFPSQSQLYSIPINQNKKNNNKKETEIIGIGIGIGTETDYFTWQHFEETTIRPDTRWGDKVSISKPAACSGVSRIAVLDDGERSSGFWFWFWFSIGNECEFEAVCWCEKKE